MRGADIIVRIEIGTPALPGWPHRICAAARSPAAPHRNLAAGGREAQLDSTLDLFVEGKSDIFAKAAAVQVVENPGRASARCSSTAAPASARRI